MPPAERGRGRPRRSDDGRPARPGGRPPQRAAGAGKRRGRPPEHGRGAPGTPGRPAKRAGKRVEGRAGKRVEGRGGKPPARRREAAPRDEAPRSWGGVARRGARQVDPDGRGRAGGRLQGGAPSKASEAWRSAAAPPDQRGEVWIDEGVVDEAEQAVGRGRSAPRRRRPPADIDPELRPDPSLARAVSRSRLEDFERRLRDAARQFNRERYGDARRILRSLADQAPSAESVRELYGLTLYRLGRWKDAARELEAFRDHSGSTEQHPVLADCRRALGQHAAVWELWEELRAVSPGSELVAEGRIVTAGSLADQGRLRDAVALLEAAKLPEKRPKDHHLRLAYALADLHERAGDVPRARQLFAYVARHDPELGDVRARLRAL